MANGGAITTITNAGTIDGFNGVRTEGTITGFTNNGTVSSPNGNGFRVTGNGEIGTFTNNSGALVTAGGSGTAFWNEAATVGTLTNSGTISGPYGILNQGATSTIRNLVGGLIEGTEDYGLNAQQNTLTLLDNAGTITGASRAVAIDTDGTITTLTNSGTISGDRDEGIDIRGTLGTLTNSGTIEGTGGDAVGINTRGSLGTLTNTADGVIRGTGVGDYGDGIYTGEYDFNAEVVNAGQITGVNRGIYAYYGINELTNQDGGLIRGTNGAGIKIEDISSSVVNESGGVIESTNAMGIYVGDYSGASLPTLSNAGTIRGATAGVTVTAEGTITKITNSGTIANTGGGTGPAVVVGATGVLGDATGAEGVAIASTGVNAAITGTIQNEGTIHYGFTIANQSVTVSAGGGTTGSFTNGTLTVADGDLTFTNGTTSLAANVSANDGAGTVFNQGTLDLLGSQTIAGNFEQTGAAALSSSITDASTFGSLAISGTAAFDGTLDLDLLGAFTLQDGQSFNLFSFASRSGGFSGLSVDGTPLSSLGTNEWAYGDLTLTENWSSTAMSLSVAAVPEPSTLALAAAGIAGAAWAAVRRRTRA